MSARPWDCYFRVEPHTSYASKAWTFVEAPDKSGKGSALIGNTYFLHGEVIKLEFVDGTAQFFAKADQIVAELTK